MSGAAQGGRVYARIQTLLRSIDSQALATARRDLTPFDPARHLPWAVLGDSTVQPVAPVDWIRLDTPEREAATWKDWREQFRNRFLELQVQRTLAGRRRRDADGAVRCSPRLTTDKNTLMSPPKSAFMKPFPTACAPRTQPQATIRKFK